LNRIERWYRQSRQGNIAAILAVYAGYSAIRQVEWQFDREIKQLSKLIQRKSQVAFEHTPYSPQVYRFKMTSPMAMALMRLLMKLDQLMGLCETGRTLSIFKKRQVLSRRVQRYQRSVLQVIERIAQASFKQNHTISVLNSKQKEWLGMAIHADVMPIFPPAVFKTLQSLTTTARSD
jgi:hypothetical protein